MQSAVALACSVQHCIALLCTALTALDCGVYAFLTRPGQFVHVIFCLNRPTALVHSLIVCIMLMNYRNTLYLQIHQSSSDSVKTICLCSKQGGKYTFSIWTRLDYKTANKRRKKHEYMSQAPSAGKRVQVTQSVNQSIGQTLFVEGNTL